MIKAEELRIGNIFWENYGGYKVVTAINCNKVGDAPNTVSARALNMNISGQFDCENIHPVPLSSELLEKAGFVVESVVTTDYKGLFALTTVTTNYQVGDEWGPDNFNLSMTTNDKDDERVFNHERVANIKSLHQLQNLYYSLTNTELNITP